MSEKRVSTRSNIHPLEIHGMISINDLTPICDYGKITEASTTGFKLTISRDDFCYQDLKNINVDSIKGLEVSLYIPMMDLDITGHIARARYMKNNEYELGIDYTSDAPEFWRECLCDLLPKAG